MDEEAAIDMDPPEQMSIWSFCHKERMITVQQKRSQPKREMLCSNRVS
jgi:hypothetical protein